MNSRRIGPYFLLGGLTLLLIFILGVRYGQRVEQRNKEIITLLSLTPPKKTTPSPSPTRKPIKFLQFNHQGCRIAFLYPNSIEMVKETSKSAQFRKNNSKTILLSLDCYKKLTPQLSKTNEQKMATKELNFKKKPLVVKEKNVDNQSFYFFILTHPRRSIKIRIMIADSLYPLFEKTLEFLP